jgi:hypothetical protein
MFSGPSQHWRTICILSIACVCGNQAVGCHLITMLGYTAVRPIEVPKKKHSALPWLTFLFVVSYALMTMLIVEQGAAIQSQRNLINVLLPDSQELWALKGKSVGKKGAGVQAPNGKQAPKSQTPSTQSPLTQGPKSHSQKLDGKTAKPEDKAPPMPAADFLDQRRALHTI